jgi:hypothetical protein
MSTKTVALSVRVDSDDAAFLDAIEIGGADTASEKLRALIADARTRHEAGRSFESSLSLLRELLEPVSQTLRARELAQRQRSELIADTLYWLPDVLAFLMAGPAPRAGKGEAKDLIEFEAGVAQRIFHFIEAVLRLGVTARAPCYEPEVVTQGLAGTLELAQMIIQHRGRKPVS